MCTSLCGSGIKTQRHRVAHSHCDRVRGSGANVYRRRKGGEKRKGGETAAALNPTRVQAEEELSALAPPETLV